MFLTLFILLLIFGLQKIFQHCSMSAPSLCTTKYIRQYFTDGTLPKSGTMCETDLGPFDSVKEGSTEDAQGKLLMDMNEEDKLLLSAIRELSSSQFTNQLVRTTLTLA